MSEHAVAISELQMLRAWIREGDYVTDDARDEIARAITSRIRTLELESEPAIFYLNNESSGQTKPFKYPLRVEITHINFWNKHQLARRPR